MRIRQLDLIKYGKFAGDRLSFPKAPHDFHLIVGQNEAGKSTLRNAIAEWLFGMPLRTPMAFVHELPDLRLGGVIENAHAELAFHRARGRTPLRTPADDRLPDDALGPYLGGATKEFFEQMFGLDHARLVQGGEDLIDASNDLGRMLFQSAAGIGSLGPVRDELEDEANTLWAPRARSSAFAKAEAELDAATADLKQAQVRTKQWSDARAALDAVDEEIAQGREERARLDAVRTSLERMRRVAPLLQQLTAKETELSALAEVPQMPAGAADTLARAQSELAAALKLLEERSRDVAARQRELGAIELDAATLALVVDIQALDALRGACIHHERDLPLREAEVERLLADAAAAARELGWPEDEAALRALLPSRLDLQTVTTLAGERAQHEQAVQHAEDAVRHKQAELGGVEEALRATNVLTVPPRAARGASGGPDALAQPRPAG